MPEPFQRAVVWAGWSLLVLAAVLAAVLLVGRARAERADRFVEIVVDGRSLQALARHEGLLYIDLLKRLRAGGATAVAVAEQDLASLQEAGALVALTGAELRRAAVNEPLSPWVMNLVRGGAVADGHTYVIADQAEVYAMVRDRLPAGRVREVSPGVLEIALARDRVGQLTFGFDQSDFDAAREAGLRTVVRPANLAGGFEQVAGVLEALDRLDATTRLVIFQGSEVLGYPDALGTTADALDSRGWVLGLVEQPAGPGYIVQRGVTRLAELLDYRVARVSTRPEGIRRGARVIYLRPNPDDPGLTAVTAAARLVQEQALTAGPAVGFAYVRVGRSLLALLSLGTAGAALVIAAQHCRRPIALAAISATVLLGALGWPYAAPLAGGWIPAAVPALWSALAVSTVLARPPDSASPLREALATLGWFFLLGVGGGMAGGALRASPQALLGMTASPGPLLTLGGGMVLAAGVYAWVHRYDLNLQAPVTRTQVLNAALTAGVLAVSIALPAWAPALIGGAALASQSRRLRPASLGAGAAGAMMLGLALQGAVLVPVAMALAGGAAGLTAEIILLFRSADGRRQIGPSRGRETA